MTLHEQKEKAKELLRSEQFEQALPLFQVIWETEKSEWNGYYLAQCLRKFENYGEAAELHEKLAEYPTKQVFINYDEYLLTFKEGIGLLNYPITLVA